MSVSYSISVSLPVFKELTARLCEGQVHDDVLRDLLNVDSDVEPEDPSPGVVSVLSDSFRRAMHGSSENRGFYSRDLWLPNRTKLRARYKGRDYTAEIKDDVWIDDKGHEHSSPSAAASAITRNNVNGLRFWLARRPTDTGWRRLDQLTSQ